MFWFSFSKNFFIRKEIFDIILVLGSDSMKNRLDKEMVSRGMVPSRSKAQELINSNLVLCDGKVISKCGFIVTLDTLITILDNDKLKYVSRGGLKLEKVIKEFDISFTGLKVMDIGSSTGGFCDCALQHGASSVVAIDVGSNLLHESLRNNKKIELHEKTNFKELDSKYFKDIDIIVCDVSFISLKQIIDKVYSEGIKIDLVCLIKPQFECGRDIASKYKGIILNRRVHIDIINSLIKYFNELGFFVRNLTYSPIKGGDGNIEYLVYLSNKVNVNNNIDVINLVNLSFSNKG